VGRINMTPEDLYVLFITILSAALLTPTVVFFALGIINPDLRMWRYLAASCLALFLATLLIAVREFLPATYRTILANTLIGVGYYFALVTLQTFKAVKKQKKLDIILLSTYMVAISSITILANTYENRVVVVSSGVFVFSLMILLRTYERSATVNKIGASAVIVAMALNIVMSAGRGVAALVNQDQTFLSLSFWDPSYFAASIFIVFAISIGFFMIGNSITLDQTRFALERERALTGELKESLEDQSNLQQLLLHEIKRPINALSAALQAGIRRNDASIADTYPQLVRLVDETIIYLDKIGEYTDISNLFDEAKFSEISLQDFLNDLKSMWSTDVNMTGPSDDQLLQADPVLLDIAISNILENARKFSKVFRLNVHRDATHILFDVEDDGPGIPEAEWDNVWKKFYRGEKISKDGSGCGLGLYIAKRVADIHGGYVRVLSQKPSCIRFALPSSRSEV
jgi:signal transduction histidine kinase